MCGIVGLFTTPPYKRLWPQEGLDAMVEALKHRGPDGSGKHVEEGLFLGHTRLAVLDLSPAGQQPMISKDGRFVISYNGEIYNFRELAYELTDLGQQFTTTTDSEVLLAAWSVWGEKTLDKLDGIFAFAIYDRLQKTLYLVRDHLGVKPLFYWQNGNETAFASEPLAMFGPIIPYPKPDPIDLDVYFTFNYLPAPHSGLKNVKQLPPGHMLVVSNKGSKLTKFWQLSIQTTTKPWKPNLIEEFHDLLQKSVKSQLVSDAPLGLFLSGGMDSAAVALAVNNSGHKHTAFVQGFNEIAFNEAPAAIELANYLGIEAKTSTFSWNQDWILNTLGAMQELLADASCFPIYQLAKFTKQDSTVILAGDGGDELLAGYDTYKASQLMPIIRKIPAPLRNTALNLARFLPADNRRYSMRMVTERLLQAAKAGPLKDHASFRKIFSDSMKVRLYDPDFLQAVLASDPINDYAEKMLDIPDERSQLTGWQLGDLNHFLPSVLAKVDRMSMACGLEVRVPLLRRELVEFCFQLPDEAKRHNGKGKRILREAISPHLPRGHLQKPKAGFLPPVDSWFRKPGPMSNVFQDHLSWAKSQQLGWLNWSEVEKSLEEHKKKKINAGFTLLGVLQFINWQKQLR
ncbi:MAG: asparagine synthase (glutamine-hydrolyzing) [Magnetococcales bacterium]|nr:asparagine synthase (glutamine-hydrolyzing) [Magnetococcales bacterium]